jgi:hypothetical protein
MIMPKTIFFVKSAIGAGEEVVSIELPDCKPFIMALRQAEALTPTEFTQKLFVSFAPFCGYFFSREAADHPHLQTD